MSQEPLTNLRTLHAKLANIGCSPEAFVVLSGIERIKTLERENAELYDLIAKLRMANYKLRTRLEVT